MINSYIQEEAKNAYDKFVGKGKILGIPLGHREELKKFSDIQKELSAYNNSCLGLQSVPLSKIVGSVQKTEDFKKGFIPKNSIVKIRWCNIYIEMLGDFKLPPVDLYKIRDEYYVYDGNHRVSVAHFLNFSSIEAVVTEFFSGEDSQEEMNYREKFKFTKQTQLNLDLTESGDYKKLLDDIEGLEGGRSLIDKSKYWHQYIYHPIIKILKFNGMATYEKLEGDLYIKFLEHRGYLINTTKKYDYSYALVDYLNMIYLQKKYTIQTQIKINHYIDSLIRRLYKLDKERSMDKVQKDKLSDLRGLIRGDFTDELYFSRVIREDIRSWYYTKVRTTIDIFKEKSRSFESSRLIQTNQLKLYRELTDYMNYYKKIHSNISIREGILDYILEILMPTFNYLSHKKIDKDEFIIQYFKFSHRKIKFLKNGKNISLEELDDLYLDIGSESSTIQDWLSKTLKKEKTFKGDILKGVKELLLIKGQDVETFVELMDLYEGTTNYKTILHIKKQIWNFVEQYPSDDWVKGKFAVDLEKLTHNKEGLKFFKTERFMHFIRGKSNTYTIVDFYMDIINYGENTIDIDTLLMQYINR
ncbi:MULTISPECIES: hypothetical protein [Psychrilyobacter]|uniref:DUF4032 domain-containing protein n=1 Tax=Psychrilyobacter piezotolerans TaxID=2293438 RepID=A0ABX9KGH6_9FUSO|nr:MULTISPECIES: hypothetical protein [Psychrilyobacter]MCS5422104.1 hypothetical protein [Psychrilyobacter sp. S5]NDI78392.1 hypothetical protein [Psychrilyobacter piezotolerans]RDE61118.1 hypothetical protein DV867_09760 [Psychrilyobacter sp. S5]REI40759.1 hypothetical protein DYH56_09760 [Psychrilyobacter piezotolerans]